jgi:glucokinase
MILAGDIGGTKVHLALFEVEGHGVTLKALDTFQSSAYASLVELSQAFLARHQHKIDHACFGVAGPIKRGRAQVTNLPWVIDAAEAARALGLEQVWLINDLAANAYGIGGLTPADFVELNRGEADAAGNVAIISAGTGLGEAGMLWEGNHHLVIPSEGGHSDFAPRTDLDVELLKYLRGRFGQVSWENVLSGPGLFSIYQFLRDTGRGQEPAWLADEIKQADPPAAITRAALAGKSDLCAQALDLLVAYYAAEAANLALKMLALGGVYVGGGIAPKILGKLQDGAFMKSFIGAGRMKQLLAAMPVRVITNDKTALIGAARYAGLQTGRVL